MGVPSSPDGRYASNGFANGNVPGWWSVPRRGDAPYSTVIVTTSRALSGLRLRDRYSAKDRFANLRCGLLATELNSDAATVALLTGLYIPK